MSADGWDVLSDWHNAWLGADAAGRGELRRQFGIAHPDLARQADALATASHGLAGFLETPALALVADALTLDEPVLGAGTVLGPYQIVGLLARGGMGDVYRATDVRLRREVAVKVLSGTGTNDAQRVARFLQEARITAALDHPNIVKVFDVGMIGARPYFVAELIEGETLRARLGRGALDESEARAIAGEIAAGLVVAHAAGLVHRDLKPDNVFVSRSGGAKIIDFGIAKLSDERAPAGALATLTGVLLGTAGYLAPEQIRGEAVDSRADLFALGTMLFEMLTGERAFAREHTVDTLHAILHEQPAWGVAASRLPPGLTGIVSRLLEKAPAQRFQSAADLRWALGCVDASPIPLVSTEASPAVRPRRRPWLYAAATLAVAALTISGVALFQLGVWSGSPGGGARPVRFTLPPPPAAEFRTDVERTHMAFSPDGSQLAFIAGARAGAARIWMRSMSDLESRPLAGTEGATSVFWSPDGRSVGFFAGNKMKRMTLPAGAAVPVCDVAEGIGLAGTWGAAGEILVATVEGRDIVSVSASSGASVILVRPDETAGEVRVSWPWFLPDGRRFLYLARLRDGSGRVMLGERGRPSQLLVAATSNAQWIDPDYLVFVRDGLLLGQRVDLAAGTMIGEPFSIAEPIHYSYSTGRAAFATSRTGDVAYQSDSDTGRLVWIDRGGTQLDEVGRAGQYQRIRLSPEGDRVLFDRVRDGTGTPDLWLLDLRRGGETRLTADRTSEAFAVWLRDGRGVVFMADRGGAPHLFRKDLVTGMEHALLPPGRLQMADDVSPDGRTLAFHQRSELGNYDILTLPLAAPGPPTVLVGSPFDEVQLRFAPDGKAVAFLSDETGRHELYVAAWPSMTSRLRVSAGGARAPHWSAARHELLYLSNAGELIAVPVGTTPTMHLGSSSTLFVVPAAAAWTDFAVTADGQKFLAIVTQTRGAERPLTVALRGGLPAR